MAGLSSEACVDCRPGTPPLDPVAAATLHAELDAQWTVEEGARLHRRFSLRSFSAAFALATRIALICERQNHHADLGVGWGYVDVVLTTHAAGGLTRNDFIVAARIDAIGR